MRCIQGERGSSVERDIDSEEYVTQKMLCTMNRQVMIIIIIEARILMNRDNTVKVVDIQ